VAAWGGVFAVVETGFPLGRCPTRGEVGAPDRLIEPCRAQPGGARSAHRPLLGQCVAVSLYPRGVEQASRPE
jgi:hypothetical protein